jgi:hypothetical protein
MANPFGGSDEALSVVPGHTNAANLVYAMVPRTANKWREVVNAADVTPTASGNYDADGFWRSANTTFNVAAYTIGSPLNTGTARTMICAVRYNSGGGGSGGNPHAGCWNAVNFATAGRFYLRMDIYAQQYQGHIMDDVGSSAVGLTSAQYNPGNTTSSIVIRGNSATPAQSAYHRVGSTNTSMGTETSSAIKQNDAYLDRVGCRTTNKWAVQFVFVYNAVLSDADVNAIMDNPAGVIAGASSAVHPGLLMPRFVNFQPGFSR